MMSSSSRTRRYSRSNRGAVDASRSVGKRGRHESLLEQYLEPKGGDALVISNGSGEADTIATILGRRRVAANIRAGRDASRAGIRDEGRGGIAHSSRRENISSPLADYCAPLRTLFLGASRLPRLLVALSAVVLLSVAANRPTSVSYGLGPHTFVPHGGGVSTTVGMDDRDGTEMGTRFGLKYGQARVGGEIVDLHLNRDLARSGGIRGGVHATEGTRGLDGSVESALAGVYLARTRKAQQIEQKAGVLDGVGIGTLSNMVTKYDQVSGGVGVVSKAQIALSLSGLDGTKQNAAGGEDAKSSWALRMRDLALTEQEQSNDHDKEIIAKEHDRIKSDKKEDAHGPQKATTFPIRSSPASNAKGYNVRHVTVSDEVYDTSDAVAYVLPVLWCPDDPESPSALNPGIVDPRNKGNTSDHTFRDAAAVLRHSISKIHQTSRYDFVTYAIVHPDALQCVDSSTGIVTDRHAILTELGYRILVRSEPIPLEEFGSGATDRKLAEEYHMHVLRNSGMAGYRDFVGLHAMAMTWHPLVTVVDLHTMFLKTVDELYDALLGKANAVVELEDPTAQKISPITQLLYTKDYTTVRTQGNAVKWQTGYETTFLVLKPSRPVFDALVDLLVKGEYNIQRGWGGVSDYSGYTRAPLLSGLLPYYFEHIRKSDGTAVELNRCAYSNRADGPYIKTPGNAKSCRNGTEKCADCRFHALEEIRVAQTNLCKLPWSCYFPKETGPDKHKVCRSYHATWFQLRKELEETRSDIFLPGDSHGTFGKVVNNGACSRTGIAGYKPMGG